MAITGREKLLWLGCGVIVVAAVKVIAWQLDEATRLSCVAAIAKELGPKSEEEQALSADKNNSQGTEDDISLETLAVLIDHPNYDIRNAARKIVLTRASNDRACCLQLSRDYFKPEKQAEAAAALDHILYCADSSSLIRDSSRSEGPEDSIDAMLRARSQDRTSTAGSRGPVVTLEEVGGDNGEVISLRLEGTSVSPFAQTASEDREESPEELALRRWRRREAMVVEVDSDEGVAELVLRS